MIFRKSLFFALSLLLACNVAPAPSVPCYVIRGESTLRAADANKTLDELAGSIVLSPENEALRTPKSLDDIKAILRRDVVYFFANGAAVAHALDTLDGHVAEAQLELLLGESQLIASQVLSMQEAWVGADLRIARANLAGESGQPSTDRGRMLVQLIRVVEEGNKVADALGIVAPSHLARGAEVVRALQKSAPTDVRTAALTAEYHRLRGEWPEFETAMKAAEITDSKSRALCYLRGMEQLERYRRPDIGASQMRQCIVMYPNFVRAQAALVLMATNPTDGLRELEALKKMNQDHYLVMLLEPTLAADKELLRMQGPRL